MYIHDDGMLRPCRMNDAVETSMVTNDARETLEERRRRGSARTTCPKYFRHELAVSPIEKRSMKSEMRSR